ncbi:MAG: nucleotide kinase, partial [Firmicutes bacterium]|nr:nucleotide kinase [Bacillota bacterium]
RSPEFCDAIARRLEGDQPILGVVKDKQSPFLEQVREHPKVRLLRVTPDNRDVMPRRIYDLLGPQI